MKEKEENQITPTSAPLKEELIINKAEDPNSFKLFKSNRPLDQRHVEELVDAIREKNLLADCPIIVDKNFNILDGQHRFEAAKRLNVPFYWKISHNFKEEDVAKFNSASKAWKLSDYLESYANKGYQEYVKVRDFVKKHNVNLYTAIGLLNGGYAHPGSQLVKQFEMGQFAVKDEDYALKVLAVMRDYEQFIKGLSKSKTFLNAVSRVCTHSDYDHKQMMQKLEMYGYRVTKRIDVRGYMEILQEIYNYKSKNSKVQFIAY